MTLLEVLADPRVLSGELYFLPAKWRGIRRGYVVLDRGQVWEELDYVHRPMRRTFTWDVEELTGPWIIGTKEEILGPKKETT